MKRLSVFLLSISSLGLLFAQNSSLKISMKDAEQRFIVQNLSLLAEKYNIDIAEAQVIQAKLYENPVITIEQNVYNSLNGKYFDLGKQGESAVEVEQVIYLAGLRNKRVRLEKLNTEIEKSQFEEVLRTLQAELNHVFIEYYFSNRSVGVYDKEIESLGRLLEVINEEVKDGNASFLEYTRLQALLLSLQKEKKDVEKHLTELHGELAVLINISPEQELNCMLDENMLGRLDTMTFTLPELTQQLIQRPDIKIALLKVESARANLKLQQAKSAPEFSIKGSYDRAGNFINNYFALGFSMSIPILNRNQGNIRSARLNVLQNNLLEEEAIKKSYSELYVAYVQLKKCIELYQESEKGLDKNLAKLIDGAGENLCKRTISMVDFIDFYKSYKEAFLQLNELRRDTFFAIENINVIVGKRLFNY